ncbi:MAG TPA: LysM peptidoglycan-binding domain-containing protein [Verrucomicrobiae bacterium]
MNNPNPFVPKGSLLELQSARRSRLKLAVFCVLAVCVTGLTAMLIQGCKREKPDTDLNPPPLDLSTNASTDTNLPPMEVSNPPVVLPPMTNPPVVVPPVEPVAPAAGSEYTVVAGDSLAKIAKKNGVTLKSLEAANPGVVPTKLKIGQKLTIPAGGTLSAGASAAPAAADMGGATYTVKSGDTLTKIAKKNGTTVKAIESANGLTTTKIKVGQKLKIPSKAEAAPAVAAPVPMVDTTSAPALPPVAAPAPAPGH